MTAFGLAGILSAISSIGFGAFVFSKSPSRAIGRIWFLFSLSVGVWGICNFLIPSIRDESSAYIAWRVTYAISANWIAVLFYHFVTVFLDIRRPILLASQYFIALIFFATVPTHLFYSGVWKIVGGFYYCKAGPLYVIGSLWWVALVVFSHIELLRAFKSLPELKRLQVKYFFLASAIGFTGGSMSFLPPLGLRINPWGSFAIIAYPVIMSYAILRFRLWHIIRFTWDNNLILRNATVLSAGAFILGAPGAVLIWVYTHSWPASVLGLLGPLIGYTVFRGLRDKVVKVINELPFFRGRYRSLSDSSEGGPISAGTIAHWASGVAAEVGHLLNVESVAVFLYDESANLFMPVAHRGAIREDLTFCGPDRNDALIAALARAGGPLDKDLIRLSSNAVDAEQALFSLELMRSVLCAPFFHKGVVAGFLSIGRKMSTTARHFSPNQINPGKMAERLDPLRILDPNLFVVNTLLWGEQVEAGPATLPGHSPVSLAEALNRIIDTPGFASRLPNLSALSLPTKAADYLATLSACVPAAGHSSSTPILEEEIFLNYSILASIFGDAIDAFPGDESFNEEDVKLVDAIVQRAQGALTVILLSLASQSHLAEWAHDLRHPFSEKGSLRHIHELMKLEKSLPAEAVQKLRAIRDDIIFVGKHLDEILQPEVDDDKCTIGLGPMKSIYERVREDYKPIAEEKGIEWVVNIPGEEITVFRDEESVKYRVIPNYLNNAFRLTPRGGRIELGFKTNASAFIGYVRDTGPGMSPDTRGKVFERGVQGERSSRGAKGLGLYNVKTVIESQKGSVWVESEIGHGSTFYFSLPLGWITSSPSKGQSTPPISTDQS